MICQIYPEKKVEMTGSLKFDALHPLFRYNVDDIPPSIRSEFAEVERFVVIGLGGSVLPLKVFVDFFELSDRILFLDTVDAAVWKKMPRDSKTLFCVASKSGETLEIKALLSELVQHDLLSRTVIATDPTKGWLRAWTDKQNLPTVAIPSDIGGRFTHFTVLHRALLERFGISFEAIRLAAKKKVTDLQSNPQILEQLFQHVFQSKKKRLILWGYGSHFVGLLEWIQQAIAESLGKIAPDGKRHGVFPIVLKGPQDQHSVLQLLRDGPLDEILWFFETPPSSRTRRSLPEDLKDFNSIGLPEAMSLLCESTFQSFLERQSDSQVAEPLTRWTVKRDAESLGQMLGLMQAFIEYAGNRLGINAFDQPGVERGKEIARALMKAKIESLK